ncbi:MAG: S9 family peptidase [Pseudomonadales bacterium]|nr:S9 family peptidase [Pseudomonadales bacterium]
MNPKKITAAYGSWQSPITSDLIVAGSISISGPVLHQGSTFWIESRPQEGGRNVLVRRDSAGKEVDINPAPFNIRTRVHEYGGGAYLLHEGVLYFSNFEDQQIYRSDCHDLSIRSHPKKLTETPHLRFANGCMDKHHKRMISVIEDHSETEQEAKNTLGSIDLDTGEVTQLAEGEDFYAAPTLSPDGKQLAWITWQHPNMPWDESQLWLGDIGAEGEILNERCIIKQTKVPIQQPQFSPENQLYYISDDSGWWRIYKYETVGEDVEIASKANAEFGVPHWVFGQTTYLFTDAKKILCVYGINNENFLARIDLKRNELKTLKTSYTSISGLCSDSDNIAYVGASPSHFSSVVVQNLQSLEIEELKSASELEIDSGYFSIPETIKFRTGKERGIDSKIENRMKSGTPYAHGFYYPPTNKTYQGLKHELPPLLVMLHGGPTGATSNALNLSKQYWTSRGVAVLDLNYRGSTGYGRHYRDLLLGNWGIVDVEDCVAACNYLIEKGLVDRERLAIRGGSAGGYTTLCALTFTDTFKAGASHFGVSDLEALAKDTHKFEARYLDSVVAPYPEGLDIYRARSPIHHVDQLNSACIFFQGLEDKVVPPNQAEMMVKALDEKGLPVAYVPFEGEQHGFRRAENIKRCLDLELYFYSKIFGFSTADQIEGIKIRNLSE